MKRALIAGAGALMSLGFLTASAVANYLFGASLGRTPWEAHLYGAVGVLAVGMNALAPFYISWAMTAKRRTTAASVIFLWALCLAYSTTSALGFAAQNREGTTLAHQVALDAYDDTRRELLDLEVRRKQAGARERARLDAKIDNARHRLAVVRATNPAPADAQSQLLSAFTRGFLDPGQVRGALVALFALMVEVCATLGLFAALSHSPEQPRHTPVPAARVTEPRAPTRWTPKTS